MKLAREIAERIKAAELMGFVRTEPTYVPVASNELVLVDKQTGLTQGPVMNQKGPFYWRSPDGVPCTLPDYPNDVAHR